MNATDKLRIGVGQERGVFPVVFLDGLRTALDAGLSCEQITANLILTASLYEALEQFDGEELIERVRQIAKVIKGQRGVNSLRKKHHG